MKVGERFSLDWFRLDGQVAVVTGAAGDLCRPIVEALLDAGAWVAAVSRSASRHGQLWKELGDRRIVPFDADVTQGEEVERVADAVVEQWGRVDVLINGAGLWSAGASEALSDDEWDSVIQTNLTGTYLACRSVGARMLEQGRGSIVNVGSVVGIMGVPNRAAYVSSKHGVVGLTRGLALEWGRRGVRVNALLPGRFESTMSEHSWNSDEVRQGFLKRTGIPRQGDPWELAGAVLLLASDAGSYINGAVIPIDGGLSAG